jgi:hypothetical protein
MLVSRLVVSLFFFKKKLFQEEKRRPEELSAADIEKTSVFVADRHSSSLEKDVVPHTLRPSRSTDTALPNTHSPINPYPLLAPSLKMESKPYHLRSFSPCPPLSTPFLFSLT